MNMKGFEHFEGLIFLAECQVASLKMETLGGENEPKIVIFALANISDGRISESLSAHQFCLGYPQSSKVKSPKFCLFLMPAAHVPGFLARNSYIM